MKTKMYFVSTLLVATLGYTSATFALDGFESICTLDENCAVDESTLVAFTHNDQITYKTLSGNFLCAPASFNLPNNTLSNKNDAQCYAMIGASSSSSSSSSSGSDLTTADLPLINSGTFAVVSLATGKALALDMLDTNDNSDSLSAARVVQQNFGGLSDQVWQITDLENGFYSITLPGTQMALEGKDWDVRDGAKLQPTPWINSWNQHWQLEALDNGAFIIRSRFSGNTLDVYEMNPKHNANVVLWTYWGGENQHWRLVPIVSEDAPADE